MTVIKRLLLAATAACSTASYAMGTLHVSPQVNGTYIDVQVNVDCTGCLWNEEAHIRGTISLRGSQVDTLRVHEIMDVYAGQYNSEVINLAHIKNLYQYDNIVLNLTVSGPGTSPVRISKVVNLHQNQ